MSAIAGIIMLDGSTVSAATIESMLAKLKHCGPDAQRHVLLKEAAFMHALLATTPEALHEAQPWTDPATGCVVVTDSRLDNREELAGLLGFANRPIDEIVDAEFCARPTWHQNFLLSLHRK